MNNENARVSSCSSIEDDDRYEGFLVAIRRHFAKLSGENKTLFTTDATGLFDLFLSGLPGERRRYYTCNACRRFTDRFGGLVFIDEQGATIPAMWNIFNVPPFFRAATIAVTRAVAHAKVTGVHVSDEKIWGLPSNRSKVPPYEWHHMAVVPPEHFVFQSSILKNADQRAAELREEYGMLRRGLGEFPIEIVRQAHALLTSGNLYRSEKCVGIAKWLLDLQERMTATTYPSLRDNIAWLAVASAPTGYCHVRSSMIGTLLEDVAAGLPFDEIKAKFDAKMNPLQYQRPQALPTAGNLAQAEKIVAELKTAGSLARRFAQLEDIQALWKPTPIQKRPPLQDGVFSHLQTKERKKVATPSIAQPPITMTWEKFARMVLPEAQIIEMLIPARGMFAAMVTAVNADAPPILQWDREEKRNPVSWYVYIGGSSAERWNLQSGVYTRVTAVALQPSMWDSERDYSHQGKSVFFLLEGAKDTTHVSGGGFFPETLCSEYRPIRAAMEAYAQAAPIAGKNQATACGVKLEAATNGKNWNATVRVTDKSGQLLTYNLDRWD